jgi:hypothetical protein
MFFRDDEILHYRSAPNCRYRHNRYGVDWFSECWACKANPGRVIEDTPDISEYQEE